MKFTDVLLTVFEIALVCGALWAVFHEDFFIDLEEKLFARIRRRRLKVMRGNRVGHTCYPVKN